MITNQLTDWLELWRELSETRNWRFDPEKGGEKDHWQKKAFAYSRRVQERWQQPDTTRDFLKTVLLNHPESTLLDIGAGTGNWAIYLSPYASKITALEPSDGMRSVLLENLQNSSVTNVEVVNGKWPEAETGIYDFTLCSHAMYGISDFQAMVEKMNKTARNTCFLLIRAPLLSDPLAQISQAVWGQPNDSPNFSVAYNALQQLGIYANVLFEENPHPHPRIFESPEMAFQEIKKRFHLSDESKFDPLIRRILSENLQQVGNTLVLNMAVKVGLIYWKPAEISCF